MAKPGFTRLNLSVLMTDSKVDFILDSLCDLADRASGLVTLYECDPRRAIFSPKAMPA